MATKTKLKPKKEPPEDVKVERFSSSQRVKLSEEEVADRADRAATLLQERDDKESEAKATAKHFKGIIEQLESELRRLSNEVRQKATYRQVDCERRYHYDRGILRETRLDTGELITERPLSAAECQRELPFEGEPTNGTGQV